MALRIGINGFGRIGRAVLRAIVEYNLQEKFQVVHINSNGGSDDAFASVMAHLLQYDSVHGTFNALVKADDTAMLLEVNGQPISLSCALSPSACPWGALGVDVVFECTGRYKSHASASAHLQAGAKQVLISAPGANDIDATVVYGVNHDVLKPQHRVVSNASCTTNCLAPLVAPLHHEFQIESGLMNTIHAYTNDQQLLDTRHNDMRRARAAGQSMIPTKTGAAQAIGLVIPELAGRLSGGAIRVPLPNVSMVDLTFTTKKNLTVDVVNTCLQQASEAHLAGVLAINEAPLVSIDFNHHPASAIADLTQTEVVGQQVKVMAWYDNEWGFANRMLDTAAYMASIYAE